MKKTPLLLMCMAALFMPIGVLSQRSSKPNRKQRQTSRAVNALWINIIPSREFPPGKRPKAVYFDLQSDGRFIFAEGDDFDAMKVVRFGVL